MIVDMIILVFGAAAGAYIEDIVQKQLVAPIYKNVTQGQIASLALGIFLTALPDLVKIEQPLKTLVQVAGATIGGVSLVNIIKGLMVAS